MAHAQNMAHTQNMAHIQTMAHTQKYGTHTKDPIYLCLPIHKDT